MKVHGKALGLSPVQGYLEQLHQQLSTIQDGAVADYIPELSTANPDWLGVALVTVDANVYQVGDSREAFTIQSISKAITYGLALEDRGLDQVLAKVGVEPSGEAFNSISLEPGSGRPMNPMINAGAIATTGLIEARAGAPPMARILDTFKRYTGRDLDVDTKVYQSESDTGHRNRAIAHLLYGHQILDRSPEEVVELYFQQCSIRVTARDLAMIAACLANNGVNPLTGVVALKSQYVDRVLSVMSTCGMYDYSGGWVFNVGMPAKSGVGGGIMAVLPGQFGLGVFSPRLDIKGNSVRGIEACRRLSGDYGLHMFNVTRSTSASIVRSVYDSSTRPSRRLRSASEQQLLRERGARVQVYELQGELLFGNTESVTLQMLSQLDELDHLVVNLKRVIAIDDSAATLLSEFCESVTDQGKALLLTDTQHLYAFRRVLQQRHGQEQSARWLRFEDSDHAVEWCENQLLAVTDAPPGSHTEVGLEEQYLCAGMSQEQLQHLRSIGQRREFPTTTRIVSAGDLAESLFFILQGQVEVVVEIDSGDTLRVTTLGPGTVFGEVAWVGPKRRTADVNAMTDATCLEVPFSAIGEELRAALLANLAGHLAEKVKRDTELMQHLG